MIFLCGIWMILADVFFLLMVLDHMEDLLLQVMDFHLVVLVLV